VLRAVGLQDAEIERIRDVYWADGAEAAAAHVTDAMVDHWTWIGSAEEVAERIAPLRELGVTEVAVIPYTSDLGELSATVREFGTTVAPLLR
jgi:alkanesulfonate monooxygenase SsuD/methylene tetrahydromethanopterin reductase-like flavin-dependent oxidoreductase (luciferase family)